MISFRSSLLAVVVLAVGQARQAIPQVPPVPVATDLPPEQIEAARMSREYLVGDADAAVEYFAKRWPPSPGGPVAKLPDEPVTKTESQKTALLRSFANSLFSTEILMRAGTFGKYAMSAPLESAKGSVGLNGMFEVHSLVVYRSVEDLLGRLQGESPRFVNPSPAFGGRPPTLDLSAADRTQLIGVIRSWYIVTTSHCLRWRLDCADAVLAGARQNFGPDPEILLLAAAVAESHGNTGPAQALLRQAMAGDASLLEAHLRLGRLLAAASRTTEARRELDRALADARAANDAFVVYFASMSLADLDTRAGRTTSATARRTDASAAKPFVDPIFAGLQPLAIYRAAEFYQQPRRIAALRELVRR